MTTPIDPPAAPPRYLLSQQPAPQRPNSTNPVDPARLPVLTEVLVLEAAAVPVNVPVLTQALQIATPATASLTPLVAALPETAISNQLAAASLAFLPSNAATSNAPTSGAAAAIAAVAAQPSLPVAALLCEPSRFSAAVATAWLDSVAAAVGTQSGDRRDRRGHCSSHAAVAKRHYRPCAAALNGGRAQP
jgi:hypothetical protein